ncbi:MAG: serine/threonine-protein kinase [Gammaproteobacteria bacterium]|nr:serine/threonine-protein kinase [Gammaproteobacteria bacterium]
MSEICETIIDDYLTGVLSRKDMEEGLTSIFHASQGSSAKTLSYLKQLYTQDKLNDDQFKNLSQTVSQISIHTTLNGNGGATDISYFNEDKTLHVTDLSDTEAKMDDMADQTVIIRTDTAMPASNQDLPAFTNKDEEISFDEDITEESHPTQVPPPKSAPKVKHENLGPGITLKNRFVLLERLGQGGMGVVFKAKDMLKVEAKDKDPYVAIKVLTDAFKKYSGSFIALQREASKAQRLAHPNIATVYDFDRDGDTVFMTMEYLQGKPLNRLIKELAQKPLKTDQALTIIEQLCHGLAYAHEKKLIHSDFKPGNCFLLNDGTVKLLDFGIARASTVAGEENEKTMFDPGKLSAVTPAYATPEMFAGMNPDPRDDIYGLACVAYQLLAGGKHPYNKVAAPKIKELGIKPKNIKGLDRRQQRTLLKALTVIREDRIPSVEKFLDGIRLKKSHSKKMLLGALFLVIIGAGVGYKPFLQLRAEQALFDKIEKIKSGDKALMIETIWGLDQVSEEEQRILSVGLRREIITFYRDRIKSVFRPKEGLYDYPQALSLLDQAKQHYPDSVALSTVEEQIKEEKDRLMASLISLFNRYVKAKKLIKTESGEDLTTVLPLLKRVDPKHYLLKDTKLSELYLSEAEKLLANSQFKPASEYIETGLKFFPDHPRLQSLNKQINAQSFR